MPIYNHAPREAATTNLDAARREIEDHAAKAFQTPPAIAAKIAGILAVLTALYATVDESKTQAPQQENPITDIAETQG